MILFPLSNEEKNLLKRLNEDKSTIFALKKLLINATCKNCDGDIELLAAQRIAVQMIGEIFHDLMTIRPNDQAGIKEDNLV